ncbi:MAG: hypothetical protein JNM93_02005, partial [Bacteriovoracaceae bacterium]|nr:hypothetical protein [Bacteriovoracaceae bacterium]
MVLKIMTSNIRYSNPDDGKHHWDYRKHFLSSLMNKYQLDFLGTQEGRQQQ